MTTKFFVTFSDGTQATILDMEGRDLDYIRESVSERFGPHRIASVEDANPTEEDDEHQEREGLSRSPTAGWEYPEPGSW